jgi:hypothetical protein
METLSQLDISNPDHITVFTRDNRVTVSVVKDGTSVTLGFPLQQVFNTSPHSPSPQPVVKGVVGGSSKMNLTSADKEFLQLMKQRALRFNSKLDDDKVREIKLMLSDSHLLDKFRSLHAAHLAFAEKYGVSVHTIRSIAKGTSWRHVKV